MSAIPSLTSAGSSLLQLLDPATSSQSDSSLLGAFATKEAAATATSDTTSTTAATGTGTSTGSTSALLSQIQSAVSTALQGALQSNTSDLKGTIYTTLVGVLTKNGIDPKTFQPLTSPSGDSAPPPVDYTTSNILARVLAAVNQANSASDPLTALSTTDSSSGASNLLSLLAPAASNPSTAGTLSNLFGTTASNNSTTTALASLLSGSTSNSQNNGSTISQLLATQYNPQDLLGFLFDSGQ